MSFKQVTLVAAITLVNFLAIACPSPNSVLGQEPKPLDHDLKVHEWGVFSAPRDALWLKQDMLVEWSSFPDFFHGYWPREKLAYRGPVRKPVVFFHSKNKMEVLLKIRFANGRPLIWWPPAEHPSQGGWSQPLVEKEKGDVLSYLLFMIKLNHRDAKQREVPKDHWLQHLREVKSADVMTVGGLHRLGHQAERENFVYYDGLMKAPPHPLVDRTKHGIAIKTDLRNGWYDLVAIERRDGKIYLGQLETIKSGKQETQLTMREADEKTLSRLPEQYLEKMVAAGLYRDEAHSLLKIWDEGLFRQKGLTIFFRIDPKTYDAWLPTVIKPKPKEFVRLGIVVHHHLEPELNEKIAQLIKQLGARDYATRSQADKQLRQIGGPALKPLQEAMKNADTEVRMRCAKILKLDEMQKQAEALMNRKKHW